MAFTARLPTVAPLTEKKRSATLDPRSSPPTRRGVASRRWARTDDTLRIGVLALILTACAAATPAAAVVSPALLDKARAQGEVRVIVTLRTAPTAPAAEIERAKQSVLDAIAATPHHVISRLENLPQLVLDASESTLNALAASPEVLRIQEPRGLRPMPQ